MAQLTSTLTHNASLGLQFVAKYLFPFGLVLLLVGLPLQAATLVMGSVKNSSAQAGVTVVLLEQNPEKAPAGPVARTQTDGQGRFEIFLESVDPKSQYQLGTRVGGELYSTAPFTLDPAQKVKEVDIELPEQGTQRLQGKFKISGRVVTPPGAEPRSFKVVLLETDLHQRSQNPLMMRETSKDGRFSFEFTSLTPGNALYLGTLYGRLSVGSDFIQLSASRPTAEVDLAIPQIAEAADQLKYLRNVIFIDQYPDSLQVTEVILVENPLAAVVDSFAHPLTKALPPEAYDFNAEQGEAMEFATNKGQVEVRMMAQPGKTELLFSYRLPGRNQEFAVGLFPGTQETELVHSGVGMDLAWVDQQNQVEVSRQGHEGQSFLSQKVRVAPNQTQARFEVSGLRMDQRRLYYPATFLLIFLLSGLFWYLKIKQPAAPPAAA